MTTPSTTAARGHDVRRLTVAGPTGRADLAVPATVTLAGLLPVLLRHVAGPEAHGGGWVLQRLGEAPLDPDGTPEALDLRDGDVLHLRPAESPLAEVHFDDIAEGVAEVIGTPAERWRPELTRRLLTGLGATLIVLLAAAVPAVEPGRAAAGYAAAAAVALTAGCVLTSRLRPDPRAALTAGLGGTLLAALAGAAARHGGAAVLTPGRGDLALAGLAAATTATAALLFGRRLPTRVLGSAAATGLAAVLGALLAAALDLDATRATALLAVAALLAASPGLRLALRAARLRVPQLPRSAEELQQDIEPEPAARTTARTRTADALLGAASVAVCAVVTLACLLLAREPGWAAPALATTLGATALLRARTLPGPWQRVPAALAGTLAPALVLLARADHGHPLLRAAVLLLLTAAALALLLAAGRRPGPPPRPVWGHAGDLLDTWTAVLLVPLLLHLLHVYGYVRTLAG
ncbi:type VII secretion integral membrane protein EccD [Kitasatospora sp. NBC_00374]|uniref:type VII secretion integral membrane protein EccD n=1 Tax=Kitasatospora sp. NBC_00374 TaxID=2975964 RepID=UPI0030E1A9ED